MSASSISLILTLEPLAFCLAAYPSTSQPVYKDRPVRFFICNVLCVHIPRELTKSISPSEQNPYNSLQATISRYLSATSLCSSYTAPSAGVCLTAFGRPQRRRAHKCTQQSLLVSLQNAHTPFFKRSALWKLRAARNLREAEPSRCGCGGGTGDGPGTDWGRTGQRWRRTGSARSEARGCWNCPALRAWCAWNIRGWCGMSARCCGLWEERKGCRG